jgi:drug/metabolite transporter (DMT)-like permease
MGMRRESTALAITYSITAAFMYAALALLVKFTERTLPNSMIIFFRQVFSLLILFPIFLMTIESTKELKTTCFSLQLIRTLTSLAAVICFYFAIRYLPLTDAVLLSYTRHLFIPIVSFLWFRRKWKKSTWIGLITGFLGVALILRPDEKLFDTAALIGLASGMFGGIAFTTIRRMTRSESADRILLYFLILSIPLASLLLINNWKKPSLDEWGLLLMVGFGSMIYQMCLTRAYQHANACKVGSLLYSSVAFAFIFDVFLGEGIIPFVSIIGVVLIIFGSIIALKGQG